MKLQSLTSGSRFVLLRTAQLCVEVWRSENANNRRLEGATR